MSKKELVQAVAAKTGEKQSEAEAAVNAVIDAIVETLAGGDSVAIPGFGTFKVTEHAARTAKNPRTGETVNVPASKSVSFKVGKTLKDSLN